MPQQFTVNLPHHSNGHMAQCNANLSRLAPNHPENGGEEYRELGIRSYTTLDQVVKGHTKDTRPKPVTPGIKKPVISSLHSAMVDIFEDSHCNLGGRGHHH